MRIFRFWFPVFLWMAVIYSFSAKERLEISPYDIVNFLFFKTLHLLEYAFLFTLYVRAFINTTRSKNYPSYIMAFMLTVLFAVLDEIHQRFVPTRQGTLRDGIIDALGALLAWTIMITLLPKARGRLKSLARSWQLIL